MKNITYALLLLLVLAKTVLADTYHYDADGNIDSHTNSQGTTTYGYDSLNRLNSEAGPAATQTFTYDADGNRLTDKLGSYTYGTASNRMATRHGAAVSFDAAGNMTNDGMGHTFAYNQAGRLYQVYSGSTLLASYYYDFKGQRTRKVTTSSAPQGAQTIIYHYDEWHHLIGESAGNGSPLHTYVWRDNTPVAQIDYVPSRRVIYLEADQNNTPRLGRDQGGAIIWQWNSDAFGSTAPTASTGVTVNLRFPGQYFDIESGLDYNLFRDYDAKAGRYVESDPIGMNGGINTFAYVGGNPIRFSDPRGLCPVCGILLYYAAVYAEEITLATITAAEIASGVPNPASSATPFIGRAAQKATHDVYLGIKDGDAVYAGITKNLACRASQHGNRFDDLKKLTSSPVTKDEARAIEQALINNNPQFQNQINSISPGQPWYDPAVQWGQQWLSNNK